MCCSNEYLQNIMPLSVLPQAAILISQRFFQNLGDSAINLGDFEIFSDFEISEK